MEWQIILALVIAIPIIIFPVLFVWYLNIGGAYSAVRQAIGRRFAPRTEPGKLTGAEQSMPVTSAKK